MDVSVTITHGIGSIGMHHTFNGAAPVERGWMICNGNIINQTNYDAIHGSGKYVDDLVASSPLLGKNLPNMTNKFAVGTSATAQTGATPITSVGLAGHTLSVPSHNHQWYQNSGSAAIADATWLADGSGQNIGNVNTKTSAHIVTSLVSTDANMGANAYTTKDNAISQSIQPESIEMIYKIKVI